MDKISVEFILFAHAFTGCDTTSAIHMLGKKSIYLKMESSETLRNIAKQFYICLRKCSNASIHFFEELYSPGSSLQQIRKQKYNDMVASNRLSIDPALLPPSPRAAYFHGLRVHHLINVWRKLGDTDIDPLRWGWEMKNGNFSLIMTDIEAGPPDILRIVRCGCRGMCGKEVVVENLAWCVHHHAKSVMELCVEMDRI